jgi:hypothetical protein
MTHVPVLGPGASKICTWLYVSRQPELDLLATAKCSFANSPPVSTKEHMYVHRSTIYAVAVHISLCELVFRVATILQPSCSYKIKSQAGSLTKKDYLKATIPPPCLPRTSDVHEINFHFLS